MPRLNLGKEPENWPKPTLKEVDALCQGVSKEKGWMGKRNSAGISLVALFGKREGEVVALRAKDLDLDYDAEQLRVRFHVLKEHKPSFKICTCGSKNRSTWQFCKSCGLPLAKLPRIAPPQHTEQSMKVRPLKYPLVNYISDWLKLVPDTESWVLPKNDQYNFNGPSIAPDFLHHISGSALYQIIHRECETWWPHLFRHTLATRFSEAGRSEFDLMDWFDWSRAETAHRYVKLGAGKRIVEMGKI